MTCFNLLRMKDLHSSLEYSWLAFALLVAYDLLPFTCCKWMQCFCLLRFLVFGIREAVATTSACLRHFWCAKEFLQLHVDLTWCNQTWCTRVYTTKGRMMTPRAVHRIEGLNLLAHIYDAFVDLYWTMIARTHWWWVRRFAFENDRTHWWCVRWFVLENDCHHLRPLQALFLTTA